jgi:serine/threonine-protein kinase
MLPEAEALVAECLTICEKRPDDFRKFEARSLLGSVRLRQKQFTDAEPLLVSGFEGMTKRSEAIQFDERRSIRDGLRNLIAVYDSTARPERPVELRKKLQHLADTVPSA